MAFLRRLFGIKEIVLDPSHLTLPDVMPTDKGTTMRKAPGDLPIDIDIVGESFRVREVQAVAAAAQGRRFDIYLQPDPSNAHDKKAVAVFAADVCVGYVAKPGNERWFEWAAEAFLRGELLCGSATVASRPGTNNLGVFGHINMPRAGKTIDEIIPQRLTEASLVRAINKVVTLANASVEPDTPARVRSLCKKAVAAVSPIAAHAKWVGQQAESTVPEADRWAEIVSVCSDILDNAIRAAYLLDAADLDVVGPLEQLGELLATLPPGAGQ